MAFLFAALLVAVVVYSQIQAEDDLRQPAPGPSVAVCGTDTPYGQPCVNPAQTG